MSWGWGWKPKASAAEKRLKGFRHVLALKKKGRELAPVKINGRAMATTFWGKAWCGNLERYSDFANRLPRGRTYARNGSILDLQVSSGKITAIVCGSDVYNVKIDIATLPSASWKKVVRDCSTSTTSLFDLLQGKLSDCVIERLTQPKEGLFPAPKEISISCSCPDYAGLCKHAAAVMYGVGAQLDKQPDLLFLLRNVDHQELIQQAAGGSSLDEALKPDGNSALTDVDLGELFGIELDAVPSKTTTKIKRPSKRQTTTRKASTKPKVSQKRQAAAKETGKDQKLPKSKPAKKKLTSSVEKPSEKAKVSKAPRVTVSKAKQPKTRSSASQTAAAGDKKMTKTSRTRKSSTARKKTPRTNA